MHLYLYVQESLYTHLKHHTKATGWMAVMRDMAHINGVSVLRMLALGVAIGYYMHSISVYVLIAMCAYLCELVIQVLIRVNICTTECMVKDVSPAPQVIVGRVVFTTTHLSTRMVITYHLILNSCSCRLRLTIATAQPLKFHGCWWASSSCRREVINELLDNFNGNHMNIYTPHPKRKYNSCIYNVVYVQTQLTTFKSMQINI